MVIKTIKTLIDKMFFMCLLFLNYTDNQSPEFTNCSTTRLFEPTDLGADYATVFWAVPNAVDNAATPSVRSDYDPLDTFPIGETEVVYTATDTSGNNATCTFVIIVADEEAPTFTNCPSDQTVVLSSSESFKSVNWTVPTAADNVMVINTTESSSPGSIFDFGVTLVNYSAVDIYGNVGYCTFSVDIQDATPPTVLGCPPSITYATFNYTLLQGPVFVAPNASDNVGIQSTTATHGPFDNFTIGTTQVTYTFTDYAGLTSTCVFDVVIIDDGAPTVEFCPSSQIVEFNSGGLATISVNWTEPVFTDNSGNVTVMATNSNPDDLGLGVHQVSYTAIDASGNTAVCNFTITVQDTTPPSISDCPADFTRVLAMGISEANINWTSPNAMDNGILASFVASEMPQALLPIGTTTVIYTATDSAGLTSVCSFNITILDIESPVLIGCPMDITTEVGNFSSTVNVSWTEPNATDNSGNVGLQTSHAPYSIFSIGTTNVTYTATDGSGNTDSCTFAVIVFDNVPPVLECPSTVYLTTDPGRAVASNISAAVNVSDNSGTPLVSSNLPSDEAGVGITLVTVTVRDGSGNSVSCQFSISVSDDEEPMYDSCPSDMYLNTTNVASWTIPTPSDNTMVITSSSASHVPGVFPPGTTVVSYNATDQYGNRGSCVFTITVDDSDSPMVSNCPSDIMVNSSLVTSSAIVNWTEPSVTDSDMVNLTRSHSPGDTFPVGTTEVTYVYVDTTGRSTTCAFNVIVMLSKDKVPPVFDSCPNNFTVYTDIGNTSAVVTWAEPVASDSSNIPVTLSSNYQSGSVFATGFTTVVYVAKDSFNNTVTCQFTVEVIEDFAPQFANCSMDITVSTDSGLPNATVNWTEPVASDANGAVSTSNSHSPGDTFPAGTTQVVYEATDGTNNTVQCAFNVTVADMEAPRFTFCPSPVTVYVQDTDTSGTVSWTEPTATDNVGVVSLVGTTSPGTFNLGSVTVVYSAQDAASNVEMCIFTVEVIQDQSPTFVNCPGPLTVSTDAGLSTANVSWTEPTVMDDRENATITSQNYAPGHVFNRGSTVVIYVATDISGNTASCSFPVIVEDNEDPVISNCSLSVTEYAVALTSVAVTWTAPTATDNVKLDSLTSNIQSGTQFAIGVHDIIYTAVDSSSNTATCSFQITILEDQVPTIANCPSDIRQNTDASNATAVVTWSEPTALDDRGSPTLVPDASSGSAFGIGTTTVTYTATDSAGQTATCSFDVVVEDKEDPVLVDCPTGVTATISPSAATTPVTWTPPTASDNSGSVTVTGNLDPGVELALGFEAVVYVAIDASGNRDVCSFLITINEDQPPVVSDCPGDQTVSTDAGQDYASISWTEPTATDDTGNVTVSVSPDITQYPLGTTAVTYTFTDSLNLTSTCSFSVTVQDTEDPVISGCPNDTSLTLPSSQLPVVVSWTAPTAIDNTVNVTLDVNIASGTSFPEGTHEISYTASDLYGNNAVCSFNVIVTVDMPPTFTSCPSDVTATADAGLSYTSVSWVSATATDDNGAVTVSSDYKSGANFSIGATAVTVTATDSAGSQSTCSFTVTVEDQEDPVLNCPMDITAFVFNSSEPAIISWTAPTVTDNSGASITPMSNQQPGNRFTEGSVTVLYSATDPSQNVATCSFVVIVQVATSLAKIEGHLKLSRVRDQVGPFSTGDVTGSTANLADDLETLFRQSSISSNFAGLVITAAAVDPNSDLNADFTISLYFRSSAGVSESDVENAFDAALLNNTFDVNNEMPSANDFYTGTGPCSTSPCQNSGVCSATNRVSFECACPSTYMGTLCDTDVDECDNNPCGANQDCVNSVGGYRCDCAMGFADVNSVCVRVALQLGGTFDIEMIDGEPAVFSTELNDRTSPAFTEVESGVTSALDAIYDSTPGYLGSEIVSLSSGSIKVEYVLLFESEVDSDSVSTMLNSSITGEGEISDSAIFVKTSTVTTIQEICYEGYCQNGGVCAVTSGLQRVCFCEANYEGDQCEVNLNSIPAYIIVLVVASVLLVIIVLVLLALCFFVMRSQDDKSGNFIYSVEDGHENFVLGMARDDMVHMRGVATGIGPGLEHRPSDRQRSHHRERLLSEERERPDRATSYSPPRKASQRPRRPKGQQFFHNSPPHYETSREAREESIHHSYMEAPRRSGDYMTGEQLYRGRPDMVPSGVPEIKEEDDAEISAHDQTVAAFAVDSSDVPLWTAPATFDNPTNQQNQPQPYIATGDEAATLYGRSNVENLDAHYF